MTTTYTTTNVVIHQPSCTIWAEDFSVDTDVTDPNLTSSAWGEVRARAGRFVDVGHVIVFGKMKDFTIWLQERRAIVDLCWILGETLSDEERV